jgi:tripartite-type tricarboxylate transporter receptor subunit TctC
MNLPRRHFLHLAAGAGAVLSVILVTMTGNSACAQTARTVKLVVPYAAGGGVDIIARLLAEQISRAQGLTIVIENRPGAGAVIGTEAVPRAIPDGNTLLINGNDFVITPQLRKVNYDLFASFEPICHVVSSPTVIVVNSASPYRTLADLLNAARDKPGDLTVASTGPGGVLYIAAEMLKRTAKIDMTFVPYPGAAPAVNALLGNHVTSVIASLINVSEQLESGKLRSLAVTTRTRIEPLPDVPTVAESGYKDYQVDIWYGVVTPTKTPKEKIAQLDSWFTAAVQAPETKPKLAAQGLAPVGMCGADFAGYLRNQYDVYGRVIREANIKCYEAAAEGHIHRCSDHRLMEPRRDDETRGARTGPVKRRFTSFKVREIAVTFNHEPRP